MNSRWNKTVEIAPEANGLRNLFRFNSIFVRRGRIPLGSLCSRGLKSTLRRPAAICFLMALSCASCKREQRGFRVDPPSAQSTEHLTLTDFHAGPSSNPPAVKNDYEENSYAISQGQQLYSFFNCVGCHAHGGGDKGPPLLDGKWIYGSRPEQVFASIVQGRPNGMPSFRGRIQDYQVWQLVAYVRSLSGHVPKQAAPGREDDMHTTRQPPNSVAPQ